MILFWIKIKKNIDHDLFMFKSDHSSLIKSNSLKLFEQDSKTSSHQIDSLGRIKFDNYNGGGKIVVVVEGYVGW
jgi:hypothetical protein